MATMLRQKTTGDLYCFTELLAARDDMEIIDESDMSEVDEALVEDKPKRRNKKAVVEEAPVEEAPVEEAPVENVETDENDISGLFDE